jgi:hypothetical protein
MPGVGGPSASAPSQDGGDSDGWLTQTTRTSTVFNPYQVLSKGDLDDARVAYDLGARLMDRLRSGGDHNSYYPLRDAASDVKKKNRTASPKRKPRKDKEVTTQNATKKKKKKHGDRASSDVSLAAIAAGNSEGGRNDEESDDLDDEDDSDDGAWLAPLSRRQLEEEARLVVLYSGRFRLPSHLDAASDHASTCDLGSSIALAPSPYQEQQAEHDRQFLEQQRRHYSEYYFRLVRFLARYSPGSLDAVPDILASYQGSEEVLMKQFCARYGPEPSPLDEFLRTTSAWTRCPVQPTKRQAIGMGVSGALTCVFGTLAVLFAVLIWEPKPVIVLVPTRVIKNYGWASPHIFSGSISRALVPAGDGVFGFSQSTLAADAVATTTTTTPSPRQTSADNNDARSSGMTAVYEAGTSSIWTTDLLAYAWPGFAADLRFDVFAAAERAICVGQMTSPLATAADRAGAIGEDWVAPFGVDMTASFRDLVEDFSSVGAWFSRSFKDPQADVRPIGGDLAVTTTPSSSSTTVSTVSTVLLTTSGTTNNADSTLSSTSPTPIVTVTAAPPSTQTALTLTLTASTNGGVSSGNATSNVTANATSTNVSGSGTVIGTGTTSTMTAAATTVATTTSDATVFPTPGVSNASDNTTSVSAFDPNTTTSTGTVTSPTNITEIDANANASSRLGLALEDNATEESYYYQVFAAPADARYMMFDDWNSLVGVLGRAPWGTARLVPASVFASLPTAAITARIAAASSADDVDSSASRALIPSFSDVVDLDNSLRDSSRTAVAASDAPVSGATSASAPTIATIIPTAIFGGDALDYFYGGPVVVGRITQQDYHGVHAPSDGVVVDVRWLLPTQSSTSTAWPITPSAASGASGFFLNPRLRITIRSTASNRTGVTENTTVTGGAGGGGGATTSAPSADSVAASPFGTYVLLIVTGSCTTASRGAGESSALGGAQLIPAVVAGAQIVAGQRLAMLTSTSGAVVIATRPGAFIPPCDVRRGSARVLESFLPLGATLGLAPVEADSVVNATAAAAVGSGLVAADGLAFSDGDVCVTL